MDSNNFQRGRYIYATETNALMALINAECARRNKTNPPNGSDWQDVSRGDKILVEHGQKLYTPIKNIKVNAPAAPERQAYISLAPFSFIAQVQLVSGNGLFKFSLLL